MKTWSAKQKKTQEEKTLRNTSGNAELNPKPTESVAFLPSNPTTSRFGIVSLFILKHCRDTPEVTLEGNSEAGPGCCIWHVGSENEQVSPS